MIGRFLTIGALVVLPSVAFAQKPWTPPDSALLARAKAIMSQVPFVDGHNDLLDDIQDHFGSDLARFDLSKRQPDLPADIPRLREGKVGVQFWSAYVASD